MIGRKALSYFPELLVCCVVASLSTPGCAHEYPDAPLWDNPLDHLNLVVVHVLEAPKLGAILATPGSRQISIEVLNIDPEAAYILMERKNGDAGAFVQIGTSTVSEQGYVDMVPDSLGPVLYYRARFRTDAGALGPYSVAVHFTIP